MPDLSTSTTPGNIVVQIFPPPPSIGVQLPLPENQVVVQIDSGSPVISVFGRIGAVVAKSEDYSAFYAPVGGGLPPGGDIGQVLVKTGANDMEAGWGAGGGGGFTLNGSSNSVSLVAGAGISLSQSASHITISNSIPAFSLNGSTSSVSLVAGSNVSLSTGVRSITIHAVAPGAARISYTENFPLSQAGVVLIGAIASTGTTAASDPLNPFGSSLSLQRIFLPAPMALTEVDLAFGIAFPGPGVNGRGSMSQTFEVYSFSNSTSLASVTSASRQVSWFSGTTSAGTASSLQQGWEGNNVQPFTVAPINLSAGEYVVGHMFSWAAQVTSWQISVWGAVAHSSLTASAVSNIVSQSLPAASTFAATTGNLAGFSAAPLTAGVLGSAGLVAASAFTSTSGIAMTAFSATPTTAGVFLTATGTSVALAAATAFSATVSDSFYAFTNIPATVQAFAAASLASNALAAVSAFSASTGAAITAFSGAPAVASVHVALSGTSAALVAGSLFSASTGAAITAFSGAPAVASVHVALSGTSAALIAASAQTSSASGVAMSNDNQLSISAFSSTSGGAVTVWTNTPPSIGIGKVGSTASFVTNSASLISATATANSTFSVFVNASTAAAGFLRTVVFQTGSIFTAAPTLGSFQSTGGLLAGSFFTASTSVAAYTGGTGASGFLSSGGLLAGSFFSNSTSVAAFTGGTGASGFLSSGGLLAGSIFTGSSTFPALSFANTGIFSMMSTDGTVAGSHFTASGSAAVLANAGTQGIAVLSAIGFGAGSIHSATSSNAVLAAANTTLTAIMSTFTTASVRAVTNVAVTTTASTFNTTGIPAFGYNGPDAMTTAASDNSYVAGPFKAGILSTASNPSGINLGTSAMIATGSVALRQPWFALVGS